NCEMRKKDGINDILLFFSHMGFLYFMVLEAVVHHCVMCSFLHPQACTHTYSTHNHTTRKTTISTHTHTHSLSHPHTHARTHTPHTHTLSHTHTHSLSHTLTHTHSLSHTHTHTP